MPDLSKFQVDDVVYDFKDTVARSTVTTLGMISSGSTTNYVVSVDGLSRLRIGTSLIFVPHATSTTTAPTLNVNDFGAIPIRCRAPGNTYATSPGPTNDWLVYGKPVTVTYDGEYWIANIFKMGADSIEGALPTTKGGTGLESISPGNFLVGGTEGSMIEKTPVEVREDIGALSVNGGTVAYLKSTGNVVAGSGSAYSIDVIGGENSGTINLKNGDGETILSLTLSADGSVTIPMLRLTSDSYGEELPEPGIPGRIFFKKVGS